MHHDGRVWIEIRFTHSGPEQHTYECEFTNRDRTTHGEALQMLQLIRSRQLRRPDEGDDWGDPLLARAVATLRLLQRKPEGALEALKCTAGAEAVSLDLSAIAAHQQGNDAAYAKAVLSMSHMDGDEAFLRVLLAVDDLDGAVRELKGPLAEDAMYRISQDPIMRAAPRFAQFRETRAWVDVEREMLSQLWRFTFRDLETQPFDAPAALPNLTGQELADLIEQAFPPSPPAAPVTATH